MGSNAADPISIDSTDAEKTEFNEKPPTLSSAPPPLYQEPAVPPTQQATPPAAAPTVEKTSLPVPPDGGYGWVIVFAAFMNHIIVDGIAFTFGVFFADFLEAFESGKARTALVGSLMSGCYLLTAPIAGILINHFGCRAVSMAGAVIAAAGFALCTLSPNIDVLMITYGIIGGFGLGVLYLPNVVAVSYYFEKRRALATGIAVCGAGVGCFLFAPLGAWLLKEFDWKNAMLITAGISLNGAVFGALLRPLDVKKKSAKAPRDKNFVDRLKEKVHRGPKTKENGDAAGHHSDIVLKVQATKLAREEALNLNGSHAELSALSPKQKNSLSVPAVGCSDGPRPRAGSSSGARCRSALNVDGHARDAEVGGEGTHSRQLSRKDIFASGNSLVLPPGTQPICGVGGVGGDSVDGGNCKAETEWQPKVSARKQLLLEYAQLIMDPRFFLPCIANLFGAIGLFIPFVYVVDRAEVLHVEPTQASFLLSVIGITNTLGRLLAGFLADFKCVNTLLLHNTALVLAGASCVLIFFCNTYPLMCAFAAFFGLCIATWISLTSVVLCDLLGLHRLTNAFSLLTMTRGIATTIGSPMAGSLFDRTGDYNSTFYLGGASMMVGGLLCSILHLPGYHTAAPGAPAPLTDKVGDRTVQSAPECSMLEANETKEPLLEQSSVQV